MAGTDGGDYLPIVTPCPSSGYTTTFFQKKIQLNCVYVAVCCVVIQDFVSKKKLCYTFFFEKMNDRYTSASGVGSFLLFLLVLAVVGMGVVVVGQKYGT